MFSTIIKLLEERLSAQWIPADGDIAWSNVQYTPIAGKNFIRPIFTQTNSILIAGTFAEGLRREFGLITVQVFTARGSGTRKNADLAGKVADLYRGYTNGSLFCLAPHVETVGETKEWYQSNVIADFYYDKC